MSQKRNLREKLAHYQREAHLERRSQVEKSKKMNKKEYLKRTSVKMESILSEYYNDLQEHVQGIHRDVMNKFAEFNEREQLVFSGRVMQSMLFYEICRLITPCGGVREWKNVFRDMEDECVDVCEDFLVDLYK